MKTGSKVPENEENSDEVDSQNADTSDSDFNDLGIHLVISLFTFSF